VRDEHSLMYPTDRGNGPTVDNRENGLDRGTVQQLTTVGTDLIVERRVQIVMGTERCTMTSGRWYRTHAERGGKGME
jgi:hypothetical protein